MAEETLKFGDFFVYCLQLYRFILINPYNMHVEPSPTAIRKFIGILFYWVTFCSSALVILMQTIYLYHLLERTEDIAQIISSAAWIPVSLIAFEGIVFTWRYGPRITRLLGVIEAGFPVTKEGQDFAKVRLTFQHWNRLSSIVCRAYLWAMYIIIFQNITLATIGYALNNQWKLKMPRLLWYPFEYKNSYWRQGAVYLWECWGSVTTTTAAVAVGLFLGSLSIHICIQFDALTRRFNELTPGMMGNRRKDWEKLIELVRQHNHLIDICNEFGDIFKASLLVNYVLSSIVIGCFGFLILNEKVMTQRTEYFFDFLCFMCYNSLFSFYGDLLMDRSRGISSSIFNSQWLEADVKYKKDLLFVMARAGRPFMLSGYFFFASYETYTKILYTSYSYLALLLATYRKQR